MGGTIPASSVVIRISSASCELSVHALILGLAEMEGFDLGDFHGTSRVECSVDTGEFGTHDALHHTAREGMTAERLAALKAGGLYRGETKVRGLFEPVFGLGKESGP